MVTLIITLLICGKTFVGTTSDDHALWINPSNSNQFIWGNDAGSTDLVGSRLIARIQPFGESNIVQEVNLTPLGLCGDIGYDMRKPYWVMGNIQDNSSWTTPTKTKHGENYQIRWRKITGRRGRI